MSYLSGIGRKRLPHSLLKPLRRFAQADLHFLFAAVAVDGEAQQVAAVFVVQHLHQRVVALHRLAFHFHD